MSEQRYHGVLRAILPAVALGLTGWWWMRRHPFRVQVEGGSMLPTLAPGDFLIAAAVFDVRRGALLVVEHPDRPGYEMVKRLTSLPGDQVEGRTLGSDEFWVVGDHLDGSTDSRAFGPVGREAIRGVVRLRFWPPARARLL